MACGLLHPVPAGAATAAALLSGFLLPAPRRSFPKQEQLNQFRWMNQLCWKLPLSASKSQRSRSLGDRSSSGSSAEAVSGPAETSTAHSALPITCCVDSVPGVPFVISGYWSGPDVDDGCGRVEAMLQRIV